MFMFTARSIASNCRMSIKCMTLTVGPSSPAQIGPKWGAARSKALRTSAIPLDLLQHTSLFSLAVENRLQLINNEPQRLIGG